ncbi:MAG: CAP domain-containing protein [Candidatus Xenobia bacterium]
MNRKFALVWLLLLLTVPAWSQTQSANLEMQILQWTNATRMMNGLPPLVPDPRLANAARGHCQEMISLDYFDHQSPTPGLRRLADRVLAAGAGNYVLVGENIAQIEDYPDSLHGENAAERIVRGWMESPDHRENLMRPQFRTIGVGVAMDGDRVVADQVFGQP